MIIATIKIICIVLAIILIILVILQQGKGSDLGSAFGGGSSNSMFGAVGPSNFLGKLTGVIAALFLILNLTQAVLLKNENTEGVMAGVMEEAQEAEASKGANIPEE
jgi:preprotein translocase subunit SecG